MGSGYNMKLPQELADFFEKYIEEHRELGYKFVSQYVLHILQDHARELLGFKTPRKKKEKTITLSSGAYTREEIQKFLEDMGD